MCIISDLEPRTAGQVGYLSICSEERELDLLLLPSLKVNIKYSNHSNSRIIFSFSRT